MSHKPYRRRVLSAVELLQVRRLAMRIEQLPNGERVNMVAHLLEENVVLADEVSKHRESQGFEPLNTYPYQEETA